MNDDCRKTPVDVVVKRAPGELSDRHASANDEAGEYKCFLRIGRAKQVVRHASARKFSQMIVGGLSSPSAKQLRVDLRGIWSPAHGVALAQESMAGVHKKRRPDARSSSGRTGASTELVKRMPQF